MDRVGPGGLASAVPWTVYLLRCADGTLYTGIARDAAARLAVHNVGRGARYTRSRRPVALVYQEPARDRGAALRREWAVKQLTREEKEELVGTGDRGQGTGGRASKSIDRFTRFRPELFTFFRGLKRRNTKAWFEANRARYELEVRAPFKALVEEMDVHLAHLAPEMVGDPRRSLFRIHRDVRFSRDKSPYKTHAACWFYHHAAGRGVGSEAEGGAGFYLHLAPGECLVGGGIWMPPRPSLNRIRERLAETPTAFERIVLDKAFRRRFGTLDEETMLTRMPRGYEEAHPAARWLRYQSFTVGRSLTEREALSPRLPAILAKDFAALTPLVRWLNGALGLAPLSRRL